MQTVKIAKTNLLSISCDGQDMLLDHPKIYLKIDPKIGKIVCPYCSRTFQLIVK